MTKSAHSRLKPLLDLNFAYSTALISLRVRPVFGPFLSPQADPACPNLVAERFGRRAIFLTRRLFQFHGSDAREKRHKISRLRILVRPGPCLKPVFIRGPSVFGPLLSPQAAPACPNLVAERFGRRAIFLTRRLFQFYGSVAQEKRHKISQLKNHSALTQLSLKSAQYIYIYTL